MTPSDEVYAKVTKVLVQALCVEEHEIKPGATLRGDLGAESIDFLDIVFRLEREFVIKIPRGELFPDPISAGDPEFEQDGLLTEQGLAALRSQMPHANLDDLERDRRLSRIEDLFTVELVASYIRWKLERNGESHQDKSAGSHLSEPDQKEEFHGNLAPCR